MKLLLPYFIEFQDDDIILSKDQFKDYIVNEPNQYLIIIIIYDENTFSANNSP